MKNIRTANVMSCCAALVFALSFTIAGCKTSSASTSTTGTAVSPDQTGNSSPAVTPDERVRRDQLDHMAAEDAQRAEADRTDEKPQPQRPRLRERRQRQDVIDQPMQR